MQKQLEGKGFTVEHQDNGVWTATRPAGSGFLVVTFVRTVCSAALLGQDLKLVASGGTEAAPAWPFAVESLKQNLLQELTV